MLSYRCSSLDFLQSHYTVLLSNFLLPFSCTSWCCSSLPRISQILQVWIFSFPVLFFCCTDLVFLQRLRVFSSEDVCYGSHRPFQSPLCLRWWLGDRSPVEPVLSYHKSPKKGNLCQLYRTISLIRHPSKVMLKIILNRLRPQVEKIIAGEQAGFRAGRSTTEQIFNLGILREKYL